MTSSSGFLIEGYALVWDEPDTDGDVFAPGCVSRSRIRRPVSLPLCVEHDPERVIGRVLTLNETYFGLEFTAIVYADVENIRSQILNQRLTGVSIRYRNVKSRKKFCLFSRKAFLNQNQHGKWRLFHDYITEIYLAEISLVTLPCHTRARVVCVEAGETAMSPPREETDSIGTRWLYPKDEPPILTPLPVNYHTVDRELEILREMDARQSTLGLPPELRWGNLPK